MQATNHSYVGDKWWSDSGMACLACLRHGLLRQCGALSTCAITPFGVAQWAVSTKRRMIIPRRAARASPRAISMAQGLLLWLWCLNWASSYQHRRVLCFCVGRTWIYGLSVGARQEAPRGHHRAQCASRAAGEGEPSWR